MNQDVFISCSDDKTIRSFSISSHEQMKEIKFDYTPIQLLKLTEELFLCRPLLTFFILSYPSFEIVKKYEKLALGYVDNPVLLSRYYPNCFYAATNAEHESIVLIDFEKDRIVKEFTGHQTRRRIRALSLFTNSRNEEILIACQTSEKIYSYNTSHPKFDTNKEISQMDNGRMHDFPRAEICCCCSLNNQYLFCGDTGGSVNAYEFLEKERAMKRIGTKQRNGTVNFISFLPSKGNRSIRMITSQRGKIYVTRVRGLRLKDKEGYELTDFGERIHLLFQEPEKVFFEEKGKNVVVIRKESMSLSIPRWFLRI